jgi:hypothetical protein
VRGEYKDSSSKIRGHLVESQNRMAIFSKTALKILIKFKYFMKTSPHIKFSAGIFRKITVCPKETKGKMSKTALPIRQISLLFNIQ